MATETFANAIRRFGGMWGSAWRDGKLLTDVVQVTGTVQRGRIEIPLVGQESVGYKPGRRSQEGSLVFQKVDTAWELEVFNAMTIDIATLRANRDAGQTSELDGKFNLLLKNDDPHAFGKEVWQLTGCQIWQLDLGINVTDEFIQREVPMTFENAVPIQTFKIVDGAVVRVHQPAA